MRTRRGGFTLLEALLAVTLLGGVAIAAAALIQTLAARYNGEERLTTWSLAASRLLDRIGEDIEASDSLGVLTSTTQSQERVVVEPRQLSIATRRGGPVTRVYRWDDVRGEITIAAPSQPRELAVPALGTVQSMRMETNDRSLLVTIAGIDGSMARRRYALPD